MELKEKKIFLLADDDRDDTELFCEALSSIDQEVVCHCATDGREALKVLQELDRKPDIIFLDINMPVMNGWQCLKEIKKTAVYKEIPVIVYSTSTHQREIDIARELGAFCFFTKPSNYFELKESLQLIVSNMGSSLVKAMKDYNQIKPRSFFVCRNVAI